LKLLVILLTIGMFTTTSHAFLGKKGCAKEYQCKGKKGEEKITCRTQRMTCVKGKWDEKVTKLKTLEGKKRTKRKGKLLSRLDKRIGKSGERLTKAQGKLTKLQGKLSANSDATKATKLQERIKMKESHIQHVTEKISMLKEYKSQIEAIN